MKKVFSLFLLQIFILTTWAQVVDLPANFVQERSVDLNSIQQIKSETAGQINRATTEVFNIDYDLIDFNYAQDNFFLYSGFVWELNQAFVQADAFTLRWSAVAFDTIITDAGQGIPKNAATMTVDSFGVFMGHINNSGNTDMVIARMVTFNFGVPANPTFTNNVIWSDTIMTDTSLSDGINMNGIPNLFEAIFVPGITLNQGQTFGIRIDFIGDTATSDFYVLHDFRDDCDDLCGASPSIVGENTFAFGNWGTFSGVNTVVFNTANCDPQSAIDCPDWFLQNMTIRAWVTALVEFNAVVNASSTEGCGGDIIDLEIVSSGGQEPLTYSWSPSTGLSDTTSFNPQVVVGEEDVTYSVTVTDAANDTFVTGLTIHSNDIQVSVDDEELMCGGSVNLTAIPSGETFGTSYSWSNGGSNFVTSVDVAGTYSITVTNNAGCTASDDAIVTLEGVGQVVDFELPSTICEDETVQFTNTSLDQNNWLFTWHFGDGDSIVGTSASHAYATTGNYTVTLTSDSANCSLSVSENAVVLAASNAACVTSGVEQISLGESISLAPIPASDIMNIVIEEFNSSDVNVSIYDIKGQLLFVKNYTNIVSVEDQIDVSGLPNGVYYITFEQQQGRMAVKKFTVLH